MDKPFLLAVMGPTASGKSGVAEKIADAYGAALISADAFQAYRGMDIGTAKPVAKERYHLLDIKDPDESLGAGEWIQLAAPQLEDLHREGKNAIVVGGTGLYIRALFEGYDQMAAPPDPEVRAALEVRQATEGLESLALELTEKAPTIAARTDLKNPARVRRALEKLHGEPQKLDFQLPPFRKVKVGLELSKEILDERILVRTEMMVHNGWVQELKKLRDGGYRPEHPGLRAIGYRSMWKAMEGETDLEEAIATTIAETRSYAKRQRTWLRSEPELTMVSAEDAFEQIRPYLEFEV